MWTPSNKQNACGWEGSYEYRKISYLIWVEGQYKKERIKSWHKEKNENWIQVKINLKDCTNKMV